MNRFASYVAVAMVAGLGLCLPIDALGQKDFLLVPRLGADSITRRTCLCHVRKAFGIGHFAAGEIMMAEGESVPGVVIFPDDPGRRLEVAWKHGHKKKGVAWVRVRGESTKWKTPQGITLGTRLSEVEELNGGPFKLYGFAWDNGGTVSNWEKGKLDSIFGDKVILRFDSESASDARYLQVSGDREFSSRHPVMRKINPRVNQIVLSLDWCDE